MFDQHYTKPLDLLGQDKPADESAKLRWHVQEVARLNAALAEQCAATGRAIELHGEALRELDAIRQDKNTETQTPDLTSHLMPDPSRAVEVGPNPFPGDDGNCSVGGLAVKLGLYKTPLPTPPTGPKARRGIAAVYIARIRANERERCAVQLARMGMASAAAELRTRT